MLNCKACNPSHVITTIKSQTIQWKQQCSKLTKQYHNLQSQYENAQKRLQLAYDQLLSMKCNCTYLTKDNQDVMNNHKYLNQIKSKARTLVKDNKQMEVILQHQKLILKKLETKLDSLDIQQSQEQNTSLNHIQCQANISNLQSDIEQLNICIQEHELIRQMNTQEMTNLEIQLNQLAQENAELTNELNQCKQIIKNLEKQNLELGQQVDAKPIDEELDELQYKYRELQSLSEIDQTQIKEMQLKLRRAFQIQDKFKSLQQELRSSSQTLEKYKNLIKNESEADFKTIEKLLSKISMKEIISYLDQNDYEIEETTKELLQSQNQDLKDELEKLKNKFTQLEQKYYALQMKEKDLISQKEKLELKIEQMKDNKFSFQKNLTDQLQLLKQRNQQTSIEKEEILNKFQELEIENISLKETLARQEQQLQKIQLEFYQDNI